MQCKSASDISQIVHNYRSRGWCTMSCKYNCLQKCIMLTGCVSLRSIKIREVRIRFERHQRSDLSLPHCLRLVCPGCASSFHHLCEMTIVVPDPRLDQRHPFLFSSWLFLARPFMTIPYTLSLMIVRITMIPSPTSLEGVWQTFLSQLILALNHFWITSNSSATNKSVHWPSTPLDRMDSPSRCLNR